MKKFILLFFIFLGVGFYELSGGSDFDPDRARENAVELRGERSAARQALSGFVSGTSPARSQTQETATVNTDDSITRQSLDLVSFDAVASQTPEPVQPAETDRTAAPQRDTITAVPLADLSGAVAEGSQQFSMAALDQVAGASNDAVETTPRFNGQSQIASSLPLNSGPDIRAVSGTLVNMRSGPSTDFDVIDQLTQGTEVEVLSSNGSGWVELRPVTGGPTGWIAEFLLSDG